MSEPTIPCTGCRWYEPDRFPDPESAKHYGWCAWPLPDLPAFAYMRSQSFAVNTARLVNKVFAYPEGVTCPTREETDDAPASINEPHRQELKDGTLVESCDSITWRVAPQAPSS